MLSVPAQSTQEQMSDTFGSNVGYSWHLCCQKCYVDQLCPKVHEVDQTWVLACVVWAIWPKFHKLFWHGICRMFWWPCGRLWLIWGQVRQRHSPWLSDISQSQMRAEENWRYGPGLGQAFFAIWVFLIDSLESQVNLTGVFLDSVRKLEYPERNHGDPRRTIPQLWRPNYPFKIR